jgi:transposase
MAIILAPAQIEGRIGTMATQVAAEGGLGEAWARRFFENWRPSLTWQRLESYEKFAQMIDRHWDGIAAYCKPENKVSLGFVEGLNNKIRVIQRRANGLRNQQYLRLKTLTASFQHSEMTENHLLTLQKTA